MYSVAACQQYLSVSLFHRAFFNSNIYKAPTHALYVQHYIILPG